MRFTYDHAGNLIARTTADMDNIIYEYELNRFKRIKYPRYPENNVTYTYGAFDDNSDFNRKGRLVYMEDGSGGQEFKYGKMGEITELRRTMVIPNQAVATYVTQWQYDSWNRLHTMTYPDGEVVRYQCQHLWNCR